MSCFATLSGHPACSGWWYKKARTGWETSHEPTLDRQGQHSCHHWCIPSGPGQRHSTTENNTLVNKTTQTIYTCHCFDIQMLFYWNQHCHHSAVPTCGLSETYLAQCRMSLIASMLVSGKAALHTNSDRHFTASWNESIAAAKCSWKVFTDRRVMKRRKDSEKIEVN